MLSPSFGNAYRDFLSVNQADGVVHKKRKPGVVQ